MPRERSSSTFKNDGIVGRQVNIQCKKSLEIFKYQLNHQLTWKQEHCDLICITQLWLLKPPLLGAGLQRWGQEAPFLKPERTHSIASSHMGQMSPLHMRKNSVLVYIGIKYIWFIFGFSWWLLKTSIPQTHQRVTVAKNDCTLNISLENDTSLSNSKLLYIFKSPNFFFSTICTICEMQITLICTFLPLFWTSKECRHQISKGGGG